MVKRTSYARIQTLGAGEREQTLKMKAKEKITAVFEFNESGRLKGVFMNAATEHDQAVLRRGLRALLRPERLTWIRKLFYAA